MMNKIIKSLPVLIVGGENKQTMSVLPDKYIPTTLPGSRAPHVQLIKNSKAISTLDLFEKEYVLLVGSNGRAWQVAADQLAKTLSLPLKSYRIANDADLSDSDNLWHIAYEVTTTGAVLIRPDGHVAWRSKGMVDSPLHHLTKIFHLLINGINQ